MLQNSIVEESDFHLLIPWNVIIIVGENTNFLFYINKTNSQF